MLKKSASGVLASLRGSPNGTEYVSASSLAAALLGCLFEHPAWVFSSCPRTAGLRSSVVVKRYFRILLEKKRRRILRSSANLGTTATLCPYEVYLGRAFQLTRRPSPDWSDELRRRNDGTYADVSDARRGSPQRKAGLLRTSLASCRRRLL